MLRAMHWKHFGIIYHRVVQIDDECAQHVMILVKTIDDQQQRRRLREREKKMKEIITNLNGQYPLFS